MAIVTSMRWYLIVFLIGIDLTINDVDYLCTCFYYYFTFCENNLPIDLASWKLALFGKFFFLSDLPEDISWEQVSFIALSNLWLCRAL